MSAVTASPPLRRPAARVVAELRAELDDVDVSLVETIAHRCALARELGNAKRAAGLPVRDPAREAAVVRHAAVLARDAGLSEERVRQLFWLVIDMARASQHTGAP